MWVSREVMQTRGSQLFAYTKGGMDFLSAFIRAFMMNYRLTGHPCNEKWIVGAPEERGPAEGTAKNSSLSSAGEAGHPSINAHTNKYQYARQSLTRA